MGHAVAGMALTLYVNCSPAGSGGEQEYAPWMFRMFISEAMR